MRQFFILAIVALLALVPEAEAGRRHRRGCCQPVYCQPVTTCCAPTYSYSSCDTGCNSCGSSYSSCDTGCSSCGVVSSGCSSCGVVSGGCADGSCGVTAGGPA